ncbi:MULTISPECIES: hypothetical protein [Paenibacillus]|uniref:hypothetical protein n=1 Tax=Paenibacillus TaxID=44249 RepID=UPI0022B9115E|nr:hypothetical protein [Paenibacillus caseinilyticus]MCZ8519145.1 hypothetical protein [Paenibacillus caseinilyticus]
MKKTGTMAALLSLQLLFGTSALAETAEFTNGDAANWDLPAQGKLESKRMDEGYLTVDTSVEWTKEKLREREKNKEVFTYVPALKMTADVENELKSAVLATTLPGAKFDLIPAGDKQGEAVRVTVTGAVDLLGGKPYRFYSAWRKAGTGDPSLALSSQVRYTSYMPGSKLTDLPATDDRLSTLKWSGAEKASWKTKIPLDPDALPFFPVWYESVENILPVKGDYLRINSREALDLYKTGQSRKLKEASDSQKYHFAITAKADRSLLDSELRSESLDELGVQITQYYAESYKEKKTDERTTYSWFQTDKDLIRKILGEKQRENFFITELEGIATGEALKKISEWDWVDFVEIEEKGYRPTGVFWLNQKAESQ